MDTALTTNNVVIAITKLNHFVAVCIQRWAAHLVEETYTSDDATLSDNDYAHLIISIRDRTRAEWYENAMVAGKPVRMQIDTVTVTSIMPYSIFISLCSDAKQLQSPPGSQRACDAANAI